MTRTAPKLTRYSLVNPHDLYEFDAPSDEVADVVCLLLGGGWFSWSTETDRDHGFGVLVASLDEDRQADEVRLCRETAAARQGDIAAALRSLEIDPDGRKASHADIDDWHRAHLTGPDLRANAQATAIEVDAPGWVL